MVGDDRSSQLNLPVAPLLLFIFLAPSHTIPPGILPISGYRTYIQHFQSKYSILAISTDSCRLIFPLALFCSYRLTVSSSALCLTLWPISRIYKIYHLGWICNPPLTTSQTTFASVFHSSSPFIHFLSQGNTIRHYL